MTRRADRSGFTIIEAVMVLLIVAVVVGGLTPSVMRTLSHARVNRAASIIAADCMLAQTLAGRQRKPVIMTWDSGAKTLVISMQSGTVLLTRRFDTDSEYKLSVLSASPTAVEVLPTGAASSSVTVTVTASGYTRTVRMTRAGQVRVQ